MAAIKSLEQHIFEAGIKLKGSFPTQSIVGSYGEDKGSRTKLEVYCSKHETTTTSLTVNRAKGGQGGCRGCTTDKKKSGGRKKSVEQHLSECRPILEKNYPHQEIIGAVGDDLGSKTKLEVYCHVHKSTATATAVNSIKNGQGACVQCGIDRRTDANRKDIDTFIQQANQAHASKYDYSNFVYVNSQTKGIIKCPVHGNFEQRPLNHLGGIDTQPQGCPKCGTEAAATKARKTTEQFIAEARNIHGDVYDYSDAVYGKTGSENVKIRCKFHDFVFEQSPMSHIHQQSGCPKCSGNYVPTTEEWIEDVKKVHGDKYDYSKAVYTKNKDKVTIICPVHGEFQQDAASHKGGHGCEECGHEYRADLNRLSQESVIRSLKMVHPKFDYSKVDYKNSDSLITINCPQHGDFTATYHNFINSEHGCSKCWDAMRGDVQRKDADVFKKEVEERFGDKIKVTGTYSKINVPMDFTCELHGIFTRTPASLLNSDYGCQKCGNASDLVGGKLSTEDFIERANAKHRNFYDYSKSDYKGMMSAIEIGCPACGQFFMQKPREHIIDSCGCPNCSNKWKLRDLYRTPQGDMPYQFYFVKVTHAGTNSEWWDVGVTSDFDARYRKSDLLHDAIEMHQCLDKLFYPMTKYEAQLLEVHVLSKFGRYRINKNDIMIRSKGGSECFSKNVLEGISIQDLLAEAEEMVHFYIDSHTQIMFSD